MVKKTNTENLPRDLRYRQVAISGLEKGRRGKHHDLVQEIVAEFKILPEGAAMEVPFADIGGIGLANLRSAVHRAATSHGLKIETLADEKNLYVWRKKKEE